MSKSEARIDLYGDVDELNCHLGHFLSLLPLEKKLLKVKTRIIEIQNNLFNLGSLLACEAKDRERFKLKKIPAELVTALESDIDLLNTELPELKNFVLPGGPSSVTYAHVCRSFSRKVERELVAFKLAQSDDELNDAIVFLNRLSDYMFTVARYVGMVMRSEEVIWKG